MLLVCDTLLAYHRADACIGEDFDEQGVRDAPVWDEGKGGLERSARRRKGTISAEATRMQKVHWAERIVVDPEIHHGEPCVRGTRIPVAVVLGSLAEGLTPEAILHEYPALTAEDI